MENITIGQLIEFIGITGTLFGVLVFLSKIYKKVLDTNNKIDSNDILTRTNLRATKVMLDHFIEDKVGNGEFKKARNDIDDVLINEKVG